MNKIDLTRTAVRFVVGASTTHVIASIIKNQLAPRNLIEKIEITTGSLVLGAMVADASKKYTDAKIDELVAWYETRNTTIVESDPVA